MGRVGPLLIGLLVLSVPLASRSQATAVLQIAVSMPDGRGGSQAIARFAVQVTDNPASAPPRRTVTGANGTVELRLPPGNYTVESVQPLTHDGQVFQWAVTVDLLAGQRTTVELTPATATRAEEDETPRDAGGRVERASLLARWQAAVVDVWSPRAHGTGALIGPGLVATDAQVVGDATRVGVQFTLSHKVEGVVAAVDSTSGVALVRFDESSDLPHTTTLPCAEDAPVPAVTDEVAAVVRPLLKAARTTVAYVDAVSAEAVAVDLDLSDDAQGAPVFDAAFRWIGVAVVSPPGEDGRPDRLRVIPPAVVCGAATRREVARTNAPAPRAGRLPVEPVNESAGAGERPTAGAMGPASVPRMTSDDFDITFLPSPRIPPQDGRRSADDPWQQLLTEFAGWSDYVALRPPVVFVRVTPRLTEGLWGKIARGAALTQGISLPPLKRMKPNFARLRMFCGATEVLPIHPFLLEHQVSDTERLVEGLYVFDPQAWTTPCPAVQLHLSSVAAPDRVDVVTVPPSVLTQLRKDLQ